MSAKAGAVDSRLVVMPTGAGDVEISKYRPPTDKLPVRLFGTRLDFGVLHLPFWAEGPPGDRARRTAGKTRRQNVYIMNLVLDPSRGVLVVEFPYSAPELDAPTQVDAAAERAARKCRLLEKQLPADAVGNDAAIGPAVVCVGSDVKPPAHRVEADPATVVETGDWRPLPRRLQTVAEHVGGRPEQLSTDELSDLWGRLRELPRHAAPGGGYLDHLECVRDLGITSPQLAEVRRMSSNGQS